MNVGFDLQKPNAVHPAHSDAYLAASMHGNVVVVVVVVVVVGGQMPHDRGQNEGYCRIEPSRSAGKHRLALLPLQPPATLKPRLLANAWSPASSLTTPFKHAGVVVVVAVSVDVVAVVVVVCVAVVVVVVLEVAVVVVVVVVVDDVHSPPLSASTACSHAARVFSNEAWSKMPKVAKPFCKREQDLRLRRPASCGALRDPKHPSVDRVGRVQRKFSRDEALHLAAAAVAPQFWRGPRSAVCQDHDVVHVVPFLNGLCCSPKCCKRPSAGSIQTKVGPGERYAAG